MSSEKKRVEEMIKRLDEARAKSKKMGISVNPKDGTFHRSSERDPDESIPLASSDLGVGANG